LPAPSQAPQVPSPENDTRAIAETQRHLNALGYEAGPVDGTLGGETRRAIQRFQRVSNLPATGELTTATLGSLRNAARRQGASETAGALPPGPASGPLPGRMTAGGFPSPSQVAGSGTNGVRAISPVMLNGRLLAGFPLVDGRYSKDSVASLGFIQGPYKKAALDLALYMDLSF
jgi:peptidoglycan hydrolase-like protein with peptidoglycan-binding domain